MYILPHHRLERHGRCQQPRYHPQPMLPEDESRAFVADHRIKQTDAPNSTVGEQSTGNLVNVNIQDSKVGDIHISLVQSQPDPDADAEVHILWGFKSLYIVHIYIVQLTGPSVGIITLVTVERRVNLNPNTSLCLVTKAIPKMVTVDYS